MTDKFPGFTVVGRGYARGEVDRFLLGEDGGPCGTPPAFAVVARGYDRDEVESFIAALRVHGADADTASASSPASPQGSVQNVPSRRRWGLTRTRRH